MVFEFPATPVIIDEKPQIITHYHWGLIPTWAKDLAIQKYTLNAKIETVTEKPSFKNSVNKRCLVIADGFFEWQWLDPKGKKKQQYEIGLPNQELFAFAGLYSQWVDKSTGEIKNTYTILTTEANPLMADCRLQIADFRVQILDCRLQIADFRVQILDCS